MYLIFVLPIPVLIGMPFLGRFLWRHILERDFDEIGAGPLGLAYILFLVGLAVSIVTTSDQYSVGTMLYFAPPVALTVVTLVCVPIAAYLVISERLTYPVVAALFPAFVFAGIIVIYLTDPYGRTSFLDTAAAAASYVVPGGIGFGFGLTAAVKARLKALQQRQPAT